MHRSALLLNTLLFPGIGTISNKEWIKGGTQIILGLIGTGLIIYGITQSTLDTIQTLQTGATEPIRIHCVSGCTGILLFATTYLWAITSSLPKKHRRRDPHRNPTVPPAPNR